MDWKGRPVLSTITRFLLLYLYGKGDVTDRDHVVLKAYQLREKYSNFPSLRFGIHIAVVVLVTSQAFLMTAQFIPYSRSCEHTFSQVFSDNERSLFSMNELMDFMNSTVVRYYLFPAYSVEKFHFELNEKDRILPIALKVESYKNLEGQYWHRHRAPVDDGDPKGIDDDDIHGDFNIVTNRYNLTIEEPYGPFGNVSLSERQLLFYSMISMTMKFTYHGVNIGPVAVQPVIWDIELSYTQRGGELRSGFRVEMRSINTAGFTSGDTFVVVSILILLLAVVSMCVSVFGLYLDHRVLVRTRRTYKDWQRIMALQTEDYPAWSQIPLTLKINFYSIWTLFNVIANGMIVFSSALGLARDFGKASSTFYLVYFGFASLMACINLLRYLEYFSDFYLHIQTLRNAFGHIARFCLSVSPLYLGFMLFAVVSFGPYTDEFRDISRTAMTLFGLLNSDDILPTYANIEGSSFPYPSLAKLFIYTFVIIFVTSVLNVFIIIIEDAYHDAQQARAAREEEEKERMGIFVQARKRSARERLENLFEVLSTWSEATREVGGISDSEVALMDVMDMPSGADAHLLREEERQVRFASRATEPFSEPFRSPSHSPAGSPEGSPRLTPRDRRRTQSFLAKTQQKERQKQMKKQMKKLGRTTSQPTLLGGGGEQRALSPPQSEDRSAMRAWSSDEDSDDGISISAAMSHNREPRKPARGRGRPRGIPSLQLDNLGGSSEKPSAAATSAAAETEDAMASGDGQPVAAPLPSDVLEHMRAVRERLEMDLIQREFDIRRWQEEMKTLRGALDEQDRLLARMEGVRREDEKPKAGAKQLIIPTLRITTDEGSEKDDEEGAE